MFCSTLIAATVIYLLFIAETVKRKSCPHCGEMNKTSCNSNGLQPLAGELHPSGFSAPWWFNVQLQN